MSIKYKNQDFILQIDDSSPETLAIVNKYNAFLDALTTLDFKHIGEAIKRAIHFFVTRKYKNTKEIAKYTYSQSAQLKKKYNNVEQYLLHIRIQDKKSFSIDLATATGKSWVIYGVAQIMLAEGFVDKVLVLCPSLTIEEELMEKFQKFSGDVTLIKIMEELGINYSSSAIKSANDPILKGDICIENIHAAYHRTGSSIEDSFKGKGQRTLVINDEAHHIYSEANANVKKWYEFLINCNYNFQYLLGVTGTPYIGDEYFHDIIYRYGIKHAIEDGIIKTIDYKVEEESTKEKGFDETYQNHLDNWKKYGDKLKPISIIVTDKIVTCIQVWDELVRYISNTENITYKEAASRVIWVTSGIPTNKNEKGIIENIIRDAEKIRKENLLLLKTVDERDNPVEWIVSVSMLTEGWDVKNIFQIVPHERRAFNSKLLISQVLGRGLRIPRELVHPVYVKINNHEKWTSNIINLYNEVLEIENKLSWGYYERRNDYLFPLYNLEYSFEEDTVEVKKKKAKEPQNVKFSPQSKKWEETSKYSETGYFTFTVEAKDTVSIGQAAKEVKLFLKGKDSDISEKWSLKKIEDFIVRNLKKDGYDISYLSCENLIKLKQSFGPMLRELGKEAPRLKNKPDSLTEVKIEEMIPQFFSESELRNKGKLFYTEDSPEILPDEQKTLFYDFLRDRENYDSVKESVEKYGGNEEEISFLKSNFIKLDGNIFKSPLNMIFVSYNPEYRFVKSVFNNINLFDSFIKSPNKGFYYFPYSYKPTEEGSSHVQRENFNPDFFFKLKDKKEVLIVEIKSDCDSSQKNKAKYRDGKKHFKELNQKLEEQKINWKYFFYFLSPEDIIEFFQALRECRYYNWKSSLMQELS